VAARRTARAGEPAHRTHRLGAAQVPPSHYLAPTHPQEGERPVDCRNLSDIGNAGQRRHGRSTRDTSRHKLFRWATICGIFRQHRYKCIGPLSAIPAAAAARSSRVPLASHLRHTEHLEWHAPTASLSPGFVYTGNTSTPEMTSPAGLAPGRLVCRSSRRILQIRHFLTGARCTAPTPPPAVRITRITQHASATPASTAQPFGTPAASARSLRVTAHGLGARSCCARTLTDEDAEAHLYLALHNQGGPALAAQVHPNPAQTHTPPQMCPPHAHRSHTQLEAWRS
jgi:hypothetical protein